MMNGCVSPWKTEGGELARQTVGRREDTFKHPRFFFEYHAGREYVHPLLRQREDA